MKKKKDPYICCLQETNFRAKHTHRLKVKEGKIYSMQMKMEQNTRVSILTSDNTEFKTNYNKRQRRTLHKNKGVNPVRRYMHQTKSKRVPEKHIFLLY